MNTASNAPLDIRREFVSILPRLRRFALTVATDLEEADELVRSACASAIIEGRCPSGSEALDPWLFALVRQAASGQARSPRATSLGKAACAKPSFATEYQELVLGMPEGQASAFLLVEVEGFSYAQAADILGISTDALSVRVCEARTSFATASAAAERRA